MVNRKLQRFHLPRISYIFTTKLYLNQKWYIIYIMTRNNSLKELGVAITERGARQQPLQEGQIKIATNYITNVHNALCEQIEPIYTTPEHPINGWGLLQTPFQRTGEFLGIPTIHVLGSRS